MYIPTTVLFFIIFIIVLSNTKQKELDEIFYWFLIFPAKLFWNIIGKKTFSLLYRLLKIVALPFIYPFKLIHNSSVNENTKHIFYWCVVMLYFFSWAFCVDLYNKPHKFNWEEFPIENKTPTWDETTPVETQEFKIKRYKEILQKNISNSEMKELERLHKELSN